MELLKLDECLKNLKLKTKSEAVESKDVESDYVESKAVEFNAEESKAVEFEPV